MGHLASGSVKFAKFDISTATQTVLTSAPTGRANVVVHACFCMSGTTPTMKFNDSNADLTGVFDVPGIYCMSGSKEAPLFSTDHTNSVRITTTGTPSVRGFIAYYEADA